MLESYIREQRAQREILLMTHIVIGYPSFEESMRVVDAMVEAGVELMELQIPFSEPIADGPVILRANQQALASGSSVERCWQFAEEVSKPLRAASAALLWRCSPDWVIGWWQPPANRKPHRF